MKPDKKIRSYNSELPEKVGFVTRYTYVYFSRFLPRSLMGWTASPWIWLKLKIASGSATDLSYIRSHPVTDRCALACFADVIAFDMILRYTSTMSDSTHLTSIRQSAFGFYIREKTSASQACPLLFSLMRKQVGSATRGRCATYSSVNKLIRR